MGVKILGVGSYLPGKVLTNFDLEKMVDTSDEWIRTRTGIQIRHIAADDEATSDLVVQAAREAIANAAIQADDIDTIIVATVTPDHFFPSTAAIVQAALHLRAVPALDISAACSGFIYGLILANGLLKTSTSKCVLLVGAETLTKITDWQDRNTCVLFGDGAGAVVLKLAQDDSDILAYDWHADGSLGELLIQPAGGSRMPATKETVEKRLHYIKMQGREVFKHAIRCMSESATRVLELAGVGADKLRLFIPHQANIRIIEAVRERLGLPQDKVMVTIHKHANVSAASIPLALYDAVKEGKIDRGDFVLLTAFGGGFTWGSVLLRW